MDAGRLTQEQLWVGAMRYPNARTLARDMSGPQKKKALERLRPGLSVLNGTLRLSPITISHSDHPRTDGPGNMRIRTPCDHYTKSKIWFGQPGSSSFTGDTTHFG